MVTTDSQTYACSLVTNPAVEELFISFSEQEKVVEKFSDDKKHMICGVVAVPNRPIYRVGENGEEYDIVFSAEAIEKMANDYLRNYRNNEVTLQHQENAEGVYLVEQWIKTDMVYDKSIAMGLSKELPVGSWFQTYYVDSNDVWKRIESGELLGFSLECMLGLEEFNKIENNDNMVLEDNEMFWTKLKDTIMSIFKKEDIEEIAANSGMTVEEFESEVEIIRTELEEQAQTVETPPTETIETKVEETVETVQEEVIETKVEETVQGVKVEEANPLEETVKNLLEEIKALKEMNNTLQEKVTDLGKKPSADPINTNGKQGNGKDAYSNWREQMRKYM